MAIGIQSATSRAYNLTTPISLSVTVASGVALCLIVNVKQSGAGPPTISSVTYGGVALTARVTNSDATNATIVASYYLLNPAVGTANVVVNFSSNIGAYGFDAYVLTGVDQTTPIEATGTVVGAPGTFSESITTLTANALLIDVFAGGSNTSGTTTADTGQTQQSSETNAASFTGAGSSYKAVGAAGAQTMSWTTAAGGSRTIDSIVIAVKASTAPPPTRIPRNLYVKTRQDHLKHRRIQAKFTRLPLYGRPRRPYVPQFILRQRPIGTYGRGRVIGRFTHYSPPLPPRVGNKVLAPFTTKETVRDHFESRGWRTVQDQINAGYPYYAQPVPQTGSYTEVIDYGDVFTNTIVNVDWATSLVTGTVNIDCQIRTSLDKITWTTPVSGTSLFVPSFRYLEVTLNFTAVT